MTPVNFHERGVGIIEVMVALAVLMFAALSISNLQTSSLVSMEISESHFTVNQQTRDMLEVLRTNVAEARNGIYNLDYDDVLDTTSTAASPVLHTIARWKQTIGDELPGGAGKIECMTDKCTVSVRWNEYIDGSTAPQYFNMAGPI